MTKISACIIVLNEEEFLEYTLQSLEYVVDEIIVVDGGSTDRTLEICDKFKKVKVFHKKWQDDYGAQREYALKQTKGDWILQIDADEVLSDEGFLLKEIVKVPASNCYNILYEHFIRDFGHIDVTYPQHIGYYRFYRNLKSVSYPRKMHELAECPEFEKPLLLPPEIKLFHCGYLKGIKTINQKFERNLQLSPVHGKDFLNKWYYAHILGQPIEGVLKTAPYIGEYPQPLKEAFKLS